MAEEFRVLRPREYHSQLVSKGQRADGRTMEEIRELKLEIDAIRTADSSSLVKLGNTSIVCGCTSQILKMTSKSEEIDEIKIKVELPPICSSFIAHWTQNTAQLLTKTLKNILEDSNAIDKQSLHIPDSDYYWSVDVEVICLNYDGCLIDAALMAILSALKSLKLSAKIADISDKFFELYNTPICSTFAMIGDRIICDPSLEEETVAQSTFSVVIDPDTNQICHITKVGGKSLTANDLAKCIQLAKTRASQLKEKIVTVVSTETSMDCM